MSDALDRFDALSEVAIADFVRQQRWFGAKSSDIAAVRVVDRAELRPEAPSLVDALLEIRYGSGTHDLYQVIVGVSDGESHGPEIVSSGGFTSYEAAGDPTFVRVLLDLVARGAMVRAEDGTVECCALEAVREGASVRGVRTLGVEQSNTSVVVDDELMIKVYRRIEPGVNPELELLHFFATHGFRNTPALRGWWSYDGPLMSASLGMVQEFVPGAVDGWTLAQEELASDPARFVGRVRRLGEVIGEMHAVLASDPEDPAFSPDAASQESLALLTATVDEEIEDVFLTLPENETTAPIIGRGDSVRSLLRELSTVGSVGKRIRHHGDLHLGQMLWARDDWMVIDFEGEPARPLPQRRMKNSPLRDVAGMLRSFTYASRVAGVEDGDVEGRAREAFLDGYMETVGRADILPPRETTGRLLRIYELEKAVYELRYELAHRPDWVSVPVEGIVRLLEYPDT